MMISSLIPMVEERLGILMPSTLEVKVGVLTKVIRNFWELLGFHVVNLLLIHQISKHSHTSYGEQVSFDQQDRIGNISPYLKVKGYEFLSNHLKISPRLSRYTATPNFIFVYDNQDDENLNEEPFVLQMQRSTDLQLFSSS